ncbi:MAG: hypothetical protein V1867_05765 [Candidatus Falkowbacteria bacterium]
MLALTLRKILLVSAGILTVVFGIISLVLPILPGFVLIIVGLMLFAKAAGGHWEKSTEHKIQHIVKMIKAKLIGLRLAARKITAIFF